jgi:predicted dehydrogenase
MSERLRVGVVGCGMIAQVMHLPHLRELEDEYELAAVCDVSRSQAELCGRRFGAATVYTDYGKMLAEARLDVVLDLTPNSHTPVAVAAAEAGCHIFVEKPLCFSLDEGREIFEAVRNAGVHLQVGTHKRFDPAYEKMLDYLEGVTVPLVQSTTLESPQAMYAAHYPQTYVRQDVSAKVLEGLEADHQERMANALPEGDVDARHGLRYMLLCNLVHEFNMLRGALGEPDLVRYARVTPSVVQIALSFNGTECHMSWVDLPGMTRYRQELLFYGVERRVTLTLPSPYLRNMPTQLAVETGIEGTSFSQRSVETVSFEEAFKRELIELHDAASDNREPRTNIIDGLHDVALCHSVIQSHLKGEARSEPSRLPAWATMEPATAL